MAFSTHDRLLLAFANLESYGIAARPSMTGPAALAHEALGAELSATYPHGTGSYVFWLHGDETQFSPSGDLTGDRALPLHHSGREVIPGIIAACADQNIEITLCQDTGTLTARDRRAHRPLD